MSSGQTWDPAAYARNARFVSDLGAPVLDLLAPQAGERILDLGCGDGVLTKKLVDLGCEVVAIDSSAAQIEAARTLGLDARVLDAERLPFAEEFDAVFSNAVLHWITRADPMLAAVHRSLKPGGRFVAECGGFGCVDTIRTALVAAMNRRGIDGESMVPWYFPKPDDYAARLERAGFRVDSIALIPRPTPLPGDIVGWLETFAISFLQALPEDARTGYLHEVRDALEPRLRDSTGTWIADYVRLRFAATKDALRQGTGLASSLTEDPHMSRQNKVNPGMYTQRGRLTQDDAARELRKQSAFASPHTWQPVNTRTPRLAPAGDAARDTERSAGNEAHTMKPAPTGPVTRATKATRSRRAAPPTRAKTASSRKSKSLTGPTKPRKTATARKPATPRQTGTARNTRTARKTAARQTPRATKRATTKKR